MTGEHIQAPFGRSIPTGWCRCWTMADFRLTESSAILKYLAEQINSPAYPKDLKQRAKVNEIMDWFNTKFYRDWG